MHIEISDYLNVCNVFVGKSMIKKLKNIGGQNPIEATKYGVKFTTVHLFIIFRII